MKKIVLTLICCFFATGAYAATRPFQLSLTPDIAVHSRTTQINGVTINIWGENPQRALAVGIVNGSTGNSSGLSLGLLANYAQNYNGGQLAFIGNYTSGTFSGIQWAALNYAGALHGIQLGFVNVAKTSHQGIQIGLINVMQETKTWFRNFPKAVAPAMVLVNWRF